FLTALYGDVLGRKPDSFGMGTFRQALRNGASNDSIARVVFTSPEYFIRLVDSYYEQYLHRPADPLAQSLWTGMLQKGGSPEDVIAGIVGSAEYYSRLAPSSSGPAPLQVSDLTYIGSQFLPTNFTDGGGAYGALAERVRPDGSKTYFVLGHG